jgi:hypothetical protein
VIIVDYCHHYYNNYRLYASGSDAGLAMDLTKERAVEQDKIDALYIEWEELEQLLATASDEDAAISD